MAEKLYTEEVEFRLARWLEGLSWLLAAGFSSLALYQAGVGPMGPDPAPTWFWGLMAGIEVGAAVLLRGFRRLRIEITDSYVSVGFRWVQKRVTWERIAEVRRGDRSAPAYGGAGWRIAWRGGWIMAFVDFRSPRIALCLEGGRLKELVFSTRDPETILRLARGRLAGK